MRILVVHGPNLNLLGSREPGLYGSDTLAAIDAELAQQAQRLGASLSSFQSNHEGALVDRIQLARGEEDGILINAGAYTHTSIALSDALKAVRLPAVEIHISNPDAREAFRRRSRIAAACLGRVAGFGGTSYLLALEGLLAHLRAP